MKQKFKTSDYSIFKFHESNRIVSQSAVNHMIQSIKFNNMLEYKPILVNKKMEVIDGQTRLKAAMQMNIPVWYEINPNLDIQDVICLQNQKVWQTPDFLHYYVKEGYEEYIKLNNFIEKNSLNLRCALSLLCCNRSQNFFKDFREGKYKFPDKDLKNCQEKHILIQTIIAYLKEKTIGEKGYLSKATFILACSEFFNLKSVVPEIFMKKLPYKMDILRPSSRANEYVNMLRAIYNYKNSDPI